MWPDWVSNTGPQAALPTKLSGHKKDMLKCVSIILFLFTLTDRVLLLSPPNISAVAAAGAVSRKSNTSDFIVLWS